MKTGRNDPCPCGSGKKYKKCCLETEGPPKGAEDTLAEVRHMFEEGHFSSPEEAQGFADKSITQINKKPVDDFQGLSREQMYRMIYHPADSPDLITFPEVLDAKPSAPVVTLFVLLLDAIGDKGLKPTAKGNLPRNFCREAARKYWGEEKYQERTRFGNINREEDFNELHVTRIVAELAGLVRKYKGRFILSRKCKKLIIDHGMKAVYPLLLETYAIKFNWPYRDAYQDIGIIQSSFLFNLYLLAEFGSDERPNSFYEEAFLLAFPNALEEAGHSPIFTPEEDVRSCYTWRMLMNFFSFFGLAEIVSTDPDKRFNVEYSVKKRPLLDASVRFHVSR